MAVPFAFPDENNDVEVIIRQLSLLLNKLALEFNKQRNENLQLRVSNKKLQSGIAKRACQNGPNHNSNINVGDPSLHTIAITKRFANPHSRLVAIPGTILDDDKDDSADQIFCKTRESDHELFEEEEDDLPLSFLRSRLQAHGLWWSWLTPPSITLTRNRFWTTAMICVVGWHLLR